MNTTQRIENKGSGNIFIQSVGDNPYICVEGHPSLKLVPVQVRIDKAPARSEVDLLNPCRRSIDLVGREQDLQNLRRWLDSDRQISVRTLIGRAGAGKTRLAIELLAELGNSANSWLAGFVTGRELMRFAQQHNLSGWGWHKPTLVVADYAAAYTKPLKIWLEELADHAVTSTGPPLRLLLLEREASTDQGWLRSILDVGLSNAAVPELFDPPEPMPLEKLESTESRRQILSAMLEVAARHLKTTPVNLPEPGQNHLFDQQLQYPLWKDPLYLIMAALIAAESGSSVNLSLSRTDLAFYWANHERRRLREFAPSASPEAFGHLLEHLAAYASLVGGRIRHY